MKVGSCLGTWQKGNPEQASLAHEQTTTNAPTKPDRRKKRNTWQWDVSLMTSGTSASHEASRLGLELLFCSELFSEPVTFSPTVNGTSHAEV